MKDETSLKMCAMILATITVLCAFAMGYDGQLALIALVLLFGGEKLLEKMRIKV
ncbi:unnamed protein product [marine sediment metagenome]|uniref:Uncharacterized protein n=1 Tax=marine sediment metagenome TaxID=412755 RepID=X1L3Z0_9ZZZZ